jgi:hypothetical protein
MVVVVVGAGGTVVDVAGGDVVEVAGGVVVVAPPPPPPLPPTEAEVVGDVNVAVIFPPGTPGNGVVLVVVAADSVTGEGDVTVAKYLARPAKRLLPNQ